MNLKTQMQGIASVFYQKKYVYVVPADKPADISPLSIGDGKGILNAIVAPVGLPIITGIHQNSFGCENHVAGFVQLAPTVVKGNHSRPDWSPWGYSLGFADGMQPIVRCTKGAQTSVFWALDMTPRDRYWIEETNVLRTVCGCGDLELITDDFIDVESGLLVRNISLRNVGSEALKVGLYYYAPLNASGRWLPNWQKDVADAMFDFRDGNRCSYQEETGALAFSSTYELTAAEKQSCLNNQWVSRWTWVLGSDRMPQAHCCGNKPESMEWILSDRASPLRKSVASGVVDAALYFDCGTLAPNQSVRFSLYLGAYRDTDEKSAAQRQAVLVGTAQGADRLKRAVQGWNRWYAGGNPRSTGDAQVDAYAKRILVMLKAMAWQNGGISGNPGELAVTFTRDGVWAYLGFLDAGFLKEAKQGLLFLEACATTQGLQNCVSQTEQVNAVLTSGLDAKAVFPPTAVYSMDDPAITLYLAGKLFEKDPADLAFHRRVWPFVQYCAALAERDLGRLGTVAQTDGFQDDMINWRFRRVDKDGRSVRGSECVPWNMFWVVGLSQAAHIGSALGYADQARRYEQLAGRIRGNIEKYFWSEERGEYAYFYDPAAHAQYADGPSPYETFTSISHVGGGHFVFPKLPLIHGLTVPLWSGYSRDERAMKCLRAAKAAYPALPDNLLEIDQCMPSMATEIVRMAHGLLLAQDPGAAQWIHWLIKNTPLAGLPENLPTNARPVRCWENGEMVTLLMDTGRKQ